MGWKWSGLVHIQSTVASWWLAGLWNFVGYWEQWCGCCWLLHWSLVECLRPSEQMAVLEVTCHISECVRVSWANYLSDQLLGDAELYAQRRHSSKVRVFLGIDGKILRSDLYCILDQLPGVIKPETIIEIKVEIYLLLSVFCFICDFLTILTQSSVSMVVSLFFPKQILFFSILSCSMKLLNTWNSKGVT